MTSSNWTLPRAAHLGAALLVLVVALATLVVRDVRIHVVASGSMAPAMPVGSLILTSPATSYDTGDVVTFAGPRGTVTHRVVDVRSDGLLQTRGDANDVADPAPVAVQDVVGRVQADVPFVGFAAVFLGRSSTMVAMLLLIVALLLLRPVDRPLATPVPVA